jgi:hypothetical protein
MDTVKEEFDAFKAAVSSMRWFMTTAVLISVLILLHIWLERFGFQEQQLRNSFAHRVKQHVPEVQKCYADLARHLQRTQDQLPSKEPDSCQPGNFPHEIGKQIRGEATDIARFLSIYSDREYKIRMTDNTLGKEVLQVRKIPLLGVEVPANDFVTVMAVMSLVFASGVWLNLRSINAALKALAKRGDPELVKTARLHTAFLTSLETTRSEALARGVRSLAIWLPFMSLFIATLLGYWEPIRDALKGTKQWNYGDMDAMMMHLAVAAVLILLHLWIAIEAKHTVRGIDELFHTSV